MCWASKGTDHKLLHGKNLSEIYVPLVCVEPFSNSCKSSCTNKIIKIESIKTCIRKSSAQIQNTIRELDQEASKNNFLKYKTPEEYENERTILYI